MIARLTRLRHRMRGGGDDGFTLIELITVVVIIGIMGAVAIGGFAGTVAGMNDSMTATSLQATRVALAAYTVASGAIPEDSAGNPLSLRSPTVTLPSNDAQYQIGYVPGCFKVLGNDGAPSNTWLHNGPCTGNATTGDYQSSGAGGTGVKPLLEEDFVLCARYGDNGKVFLADTWHSVQQAPSGTTVTGSGLVQLPATATWSDGKTMKSYGCTLKSITATGGAVPPLLTGP